MALAAEAFGNKMCFLEDITAEVFVISISKIENKNLFYFFINRMLLQTYRRVYLS